MKTRILFSIPNFDTAGSGKALLNIANSLNKDKFEPHILCKHAKGDFFKIVQKSGIPIHIFDYEIPMRPILRGLLGCWRVSRKLKKIKPHIVHSFHYSADYSEALATKMAGIKWVYTKKNMNWGGNSSNAWKLRTFLSDGIAVQNTDMLRDFFPCSKKTFFLPRGVNYAEFAYDPKLPDLRSNYGIPHDEKLIIAVANLVPVKGIEVLIEAFSQLVHKFSNWSLMIVGEDKNDYAQQLKLLCLERKLQNKVVFTGKVYDVKSHLQMAEVFVLPTLDEGRREGSPVSLLEAMANGRCVLGSLVPGIKDQLKKFPEYLFQAGNVNDLNLKLRHFMEFSCEELKELGSLFSTYVQTNYSIEKEIELHQKMYLNLV